MALRLPSTLLLAVFVLGPPACLTVNHAGAPAVSTDALAIATATCPPAWLAPPPEDPSIGVPAGGGSVLLHGAATGTQNYACRGAPDGGATWEPIGPRAELRDCAGAVFAQHFASNGDRALPEWQSPDGAYVVGRKVAAFTPDGGAASVPWLLLEAVGHGGSGSIARVGYVQRVNTDGGVAPNGPCEPGATRAVSYTADYYFYGP